MTYATIKLLHMACAALSITLFLLRAGIALAGVDWRKWRILKVLPHVNDTVLLGAAVILAIWAGYTPWVHAWLGAKIVALIAYIGLGSLALREMQTPTKRWLFTVLALTMVVYIVCAAFTKSAGLGLIPR